MHNQPSKGLSPEITSIDWGRLDDESSAYYVDPSRLDKENKSLEELIREGLAGMRNPLEKLVPDEKIINPDDLFYTGGGLIASKNLIQQIRNAAKLATTPTWKFPLDEYVSLIKEFALVDEVYVTEDGRDSEDEKPFVRFLVKLTNLSDVEENFLNRENAKLTKFFRDSKVEGADFIAVSFQYTEVYS